MRLDLDVIENWIAPSSRVLDLGCGDGSLLLNLKNRKKVKGVGIEINPEKFNLCIRKGLSVIEQDVDKGLSNFGDKSFDVVVMSQTASAKRALWLSRTLATGFRVCIWAPKAVCRCLNLCRTIGTTHRIFIFAPSLILSICVKKWI